MKKAYHAGGDSDARRLHILLTIYDDALDACMQCEAERLDKDMAVLQSMLKFEVWPSLGLVLYAQYHRCRDLAKNGGFIEAAHVLATLRRAWTSGGKTESGRPRMDGRRESVPVQA